MSVRVAIEENIAHIFLKKKWCCLLSDVTLKIQGFYGPLCEILNRKSSQLSWVKLDTFSKKSLFPLVSLTWIYRCFPVSLMPRTASVVQGDVDTWDRLFGWKLSCGSCAGGNCPGGCCSDTQCSVYPRL